MKQSNIPAIIFSVIAFLLLLTVLVCSVVLIAFHVQNPDVRPSDAKPSQTAETAASPTPVETTPKETLPPSATPSPASQTPESPTGQSTLPTPIVADKPYVLKQTSDAGLGYQDRFVFLGDSTTYHMIINEVLPDGQNTRQVWFGAKGTLSLPFATSNDLFDRMNAPASEGKTLDVMVKEKRPEFIFITLGAGISSEYNKEKFTLLYNDVIDTVLENSPSTTVVCNTIYPVCRTGSALGSINNPDIDKANGWIEECVKAHYENGQKVYYIDSNSILKDAEGYLPGSYSNGDGLHLNVQGYAIILENLRKHKVPGA